MPQRKSSKKKAKEVNSLEDLINKENEKKHERDNFASRKSADKAKVPVDYEFRIVDDNTDVSSLTELVSWGKITREGLHEKEAASVIAQVLKGGGSFDTAVLTGAATILDGENEKENSLKPESDHALSWSMISVKAAAAVLQGGGSDDIAQLVAGVVLMSGRDSSLKKRNKNDSLKKAASMAENAAISNGCNKTTAAAVSKTVLLSGKQILHNYDIMISNSNDSNMQKRYKDLSADEQRSMLLSVMDEVDTKRAKMVKNIQNLTNLRQTNKKKIEAFELEGRKEKQAIKDKLDVMEAERKNLERYLTETDGFTLSEEQLFEKEIDQQIRAVDEKEGILRDEMKSVSRSMKQKRRTANDVELKIKKKEYALRRKLEAVERERLRMEKMMQKMKKERAERKKKGNEIKNETKAIMRQKARLAQKLKIMRVQIEESKEKRQLRNEIFTDKMAITKAMASKIEKEAKRVEMEEFERREHEENLFQRIEAIEAKKLQLLQTLEKVKNFISEKEMAVENASAERQRAQAALMEQIAEVEAERSKYVEFVHQAQKDEIERQNFEEKLKKEQAAAEYEKTRLNERIKQIQQAEVIFRKKEQAFKHRMITAELDIMADLDEQKRKEIELKEGKRVAFNLEGLEHDDESLLSEITTDQIGDAENIPRNRTKASEDGSYLSEEDTFDDSSSEGSDGDTVSTCESSIGYGTSPSNRFGNNMFKKDLEESRLVPVVEEEVVRFKPNRNLDGTAPISQAVEVVYSVDQDENFPIANQQESYETTLTEKLSRALSNSFSHVLSKGEDDASIRRSQSGHTSEEEDSHIESHPYQEMSVSSDTRNNKGSISSTRQYVNDANNSNLGATLAGTIKSFQDLITPFQRDSFTQNQDIIEEDANTMTSSFNELSSFNLNETDKISPERDNSVMDEHSMMPSTHGEDYLNVFEENEDSNKENLVRGNEEDVKGVDDARKEGNKAKGIKVGKFLFRRKQTCAKDMKGAFVSKENALLTKQFPGRTRLRTIRESTNTANPYVQKRKIALSLFAKRR